jgi:hypothetical protein
MTLTPFDLEVRHHIYTFFVEHIRPPTVEECAAHFGKTVDAMRAIYHKLNEHHLFFLEPGTDQIRMANPLSAVPTDYEVKVGSKTYNVNCAWDCFGLAAMLGADVEINAIYAQSREAARIFIRDGVISGDDGVIHFAVPAARWYDDLIFT